VQRTLNPVRPPKLLLTLVACALLLALPAASARANASDTRIVEDCQHSATGELTGTYTKAQLNHALHNLPGDVAEYSGCYDAINQALLASSAGGRHGGTGGGDGSGGTGTGGPGGSSNAGGLGADGTAGTGAGGSSAGAPATRVPPPPDANRPLSLAGAVIAPGTLPTIGRDSHRLPTALVVLLVLLALAVAVPAALTIGRRVVTARRA